MTKQLDPEYINNSINKNRHINNQIKMAPVSPNWKKIQCLSIGEWTHRNYGGLTSHDNR